MAVMTRKSVPLTPEQIETLSELRAPDTREHEVAVEMVALSEHPSEAAALHALVTLGYRCLKDAVLERGYAELAASETDEDRAVRDWMHQRAIERARRGTDAG